MIMCGMMRLHNKDRNMNFDAHLLKLHDAELLAEIGEITNRLNQLLAVALEKKIRLDTRIVPQAFIAGGVVDSAQVLIMHVVELTATTDWRVSQK